MEKESTKVQTRLMVQLLLNPTSDDDELLLLGSIKEALQICPATQPHQMRVMRSTVENVELTPP